MHIPDFTDTHPYLKRHSGLNAPSPVPAILVFTFQIPLQVRAMFGAQKVMPTINAVFYMRLREKTADYLAIYEKGKADENRRACEASETSSVALDDKDNHEAEIPGSIRLLHRFCRDAMTDQSLRGQMKIVANGRNLKEIGAPSFVQSWSGKPVLLARGAVMGERLPMSQLYRGPNYLEMDVDVASEFTCVVEISDWHITRLMQIRIGQNPVSQT